MRIVFVFGLMLFALAACEAGKTTGGSMSSGESIEQSAEDATLPN